MTNTLVVKRSAVPGKIPTTVQLPAGQLAINTNDKKMFFSSGDLVHELLTQDQVGTANGVASLDASGKVPASQLPTAGTGTVTSVAVATANGLSGTVANPTVAPTITLSTTVTGLLKGDGTSISEAVAGVDYIQSNVNSGTTLRQYSTPVSAMSGTTTKADSNLAPVFTDGTQVWTNSITPQLASCSFTIDGSFFIDHGTNNRRIVIALWRTVGAVNTLVGVSSAFITASNNGGEISISFYDQPATTSPVTYRMRAWSNASGTWYIGQTATPLFGGNLAKQIIRLTEVA